jgi:hypothetical protein
MNGHANNFDLPHKPVIENEKIYETLVYMVLLYHLVVRNKTKPKI